MTTDLKALEAGLMNAVKPNYDIHATCPSCEKEVTTDNGEWLLWCGDKEHAEAILEAARSFLSIQRAVEAQVEYIESLKMNAKGELANGSLYDGLQYVRWRSGEPDITLDATFTPDELIAIGLYVKSQSTPEFTGGC